MTELLTESERELVAGARKKPLTEWTEDERKAVKRALDCDDAMNDEDLDAPPERPCADCGRRFDADVCDAPMLHDGSWRKLADKWELLCGECFHARARARGIEISLADLRPCQFNVGAGWFEEYADKAPPEVVAAWLKWARRAHESDEARREQARKLADGATDEQLANPRSAVSRAIRKIFRRHGG